MENSGFDIIVGILAASSIFFWDTSPLLATIWKSGLNCTYRGNVGDYRRENSQGELHDIEQ